MLLRCYFRVTFVYLRHQITKIMQDTQTKETVKIRSKKLKDGSLSLYLDIYQNGQREYEFLKLYISPGTSKADKYKNNEVMKAANAIKAKRIIEIANGKAGIKKRAKIRLCDYWKQVTERIKIINTLQSYNQAFDALCNCCDTEVFLGNIDKNYILCYTDYLKDKYKASTANLYLSKLNTILTEAEKDDLIERNPISKLKSTDRPKPTAAKREYLTIEELSAITELYKGEDVILKAFLFSCFTGLRYCDIVTLCKDDIKGGVIVKKQQKTHNIVEIPISNEAEKYLDTPTGEHKLFFQMLPVVSTCNVRLKKAAKEAGITKNISFHTARHTFATALLTKGADLYTVSKLLGHNDIKTTQVYGEIVETKKAEAVNLLNNIKQS